MEDIGGGACNDAGCGRVSQYGNEYHFGTNEEGSVVH